jgi:alkyldihydroxyacetonephosphate synthase
LSDPSPLLASQLPPPAAPAVELARHASERLGVRSSSEGPDRLSYARDMWPKALIWIRQGKIPPPPDAVLWPRTEEEVAEIVRMARERKIPLIPFGAGSGVCGGVWATRGGISLDLKLLERVGVVHREGLWVDAEAGVLGEVLERKLNQQGYTLGHFPSSIYMSTLGGWLATRSAGQFSSRYGKIEDMTLSVRAVTGAGERVATPPRPVRGPDLGQLLIGSEGTLCVFTGARLRVHPLPRHRTYRGLRFKTVPDGLEAIRRMFREGLRPSVVRLYDPFDTALLRRTREKKGARHDGWLHTEALPVLGKRLAPSALGNPRLLNRATELLRECLLILCFEGEEERAKAEDLAARQLAKELGGVDLGEEPGLHWYKERYSVSYKMSKVIAAGAFADTMEVAAPWGQVYEVYQRVRTAVSKLAFVLCHFSHAYLEGCSLYFSFAASGPSEEAQERRYEELWTAALGAALAAGATVSHHHGVGILKARQMSEELGEGRRMLTALKRTLDPDGIMNPGKLGL